MPALAGALTVLVWPGPTSPVLNTFLSLDDGPAVRVWVTESSLVTSMRSPGCTSGLAGVNLKFLIVILTTGPPPPVAVVPPDDDPLLAVPTETASTTRAATAAAASAPEVPPGTPERRRATRSPSGFPAGSRGALVPASAV